MTATPNGLGVMHWQPAQPGVTVYVDRGQTAIAQAQTTRFTSMPRLMPDGKGLVGLTQTDDGFALEYVPVNLPLADVVNAWMFVESERDAALFDENSGLFRDLESDQLYQLYEAENYYPQFPRYATRPYFVTTDILWELFASAYQGLFLLYTRQGLIVAFLVVVFCK